MTVHASKGLEFDIVYITGLEEGLFPHEKFDEEADTEEERRLFYVALTRARKQIYLTHAATRMMYGTREITSPSPFLEDIAPEHRVDISAAPIKEKPKRRESFWDDEEPTIL
jgi:DNA helicase-2/ATP-dependent DNA helicase PcrA